jgi:ornithine cyclodeaminase/alanine dehydrogenase-like protein (mu-crystallin family)
MPLLLTEANVSSVLTMDPLIAALEEGFRRQNAGEAANHPRRRLHSPDGTFHFMEAADFGLGRAAIKAYASFRPKTRFLVLLYDTTNGDLLAIIEADRLGQMRTGAASGIATKHLARPDAATLALFGTGWQAESQAMAVAAVRPLRRIQVYSRNAERRVDFARRLAELVHTEVAPVESPADALEGADIVVTATTSRVPVFDGTNLAPGTHVNAVGSNMLSKAEVDLTTVARADLVVVDSLEQARLEAGELIAPADARKFRWEQAVELREVVGGTRPGRTRPDQITLFKSVGIALEDVVAASLVYDRAVAEGIGKEIGLWDSA